MSKAILILVFISIAILTPLPIPATHILNNYSTMGSTIDTGNWSIVEQVFYKTGPVEVYTGLERVSNDMVVGVGADQTAEPDTACIFLYHIGDTVPYKMDCKPNDGIGLYDIYSPWRNGSALVVGWRDPVSLKPSGIFIYRYDVEGYSLKPLISYDDPLFDDERMNMIIGFDNTIIVSGKVYERTWGDRIPMVYIFKYEDGEWRLEDSISRKGSIIFRNDDPSGNPRIFLLVKEEGNIKIFRIDTSTGGVEDFDTVKGERITIFHSVGAIGKDVLGVTEGSTIKLWSPDRGVFYQYTFKNGFNSVSVKASRLGDNYALIYGYNNMNGYKGPVYMTNLVDLDRKFGKDDWRIKWNTYAPILITNNYLVASTAKGLGDGIITVYQVKTIKPTTTTTTTTTTQTTESTTETTTQNTQTQQSTTTRTQETTGQGTTHTSSMENKTTITVTASGSDTFIIVGLSIALIAVIGLLVFFIIKRR